MPRLLEFDGPGGPVRIEVASPAGELDPVKSAKEIVESVGENVENVLAMAGRVASAFAGALATAPVESAAVEFGLQFTAKGRLYVVESEAEAAMKVTFTLRPTVSPGGPSPG